MFAESSSLAWFYEETFRWGQLGPRSGRPGNLVREHALSSGLRQGVGLGFELLVVCADAGVSDNHGDDGAINVPKLKRFWWGFLSLSTA